MRISERKEESNRTGGRERELERDIKERARVEDRRKIDKNVRDKEGVLWLSSYDNIFL